MAVNLHLKSITELRVMAQYLGITVNLGWDKRKLGDMIDAKMQASLNLAPAVSDEPSDALLRTTPRAHNLSQKAVLAALAKYKDSGLVVTFPTPDTIRLTHTVSREDSCSLRVPLRVIVACARKVIHG